MSDPEKLGETPISEEAERLRDEIGEDLCRILDTVIEEKYADAVQKMHAVLEAEPEHLETDKEIDDLTLNAYVHAMTEMEREEFADRRILAAFQGDDKQALLVRTVRAMNAEHKAIYERSLKRKLSEND